MIKANKGLMGSFKPIKENESEYTHIILTVEENNSLIKDIHNEKNRCSTLEQKYKIELENIQKLKNEQIAKRDILIKSLEEQLAEQKKLNDNLLRISKERANAQRGIKPKKERSGFIALSMEQYVYKLKYRKTIDISCWKVKIQTPYNIDMDFTHIQELMNDNIKFLMGECLGVTNLWRNGRIKEIDIDKIENDFKNRVVVFNTNYKANIKQGFWEVEYLINKPVNIPNELRA